MDVDGAEDNQTTLRVKRKLDEVEVAKVHLEGLLDERDTLDE